MIQFEKKTFTVPINLQDTLDKLIQEMVDLDVIERSIGEFSSPIVLVGKKDNSIRFCVDYRELNKTTKIDPFSMTIIDEYLIKLKHASYLSTLDTSKRFWQVP